MELIVPATLDIPKLMEFVKLLLLEFLIVLLMLTLMVYLVYAILDSQEMIIMNAHDVKQVNHGTDIVVSHQSHQPHPLHKLHPPHQAHQLHQVLQIKHHQRQQEIHVQVALFSIVFQINVSQQLPNAVNIQPGTELYVFAQRVLIKSTDVVKYALKELLLMEQNVLIVKRLLLLSHVAQIKLKFLENVFVLLISMILMVNALNALKILNGTVNFVIVK
jgi:hypothetical protein